MKKVHTHIQIDSDHFEILTGGRRLQVNLKIDGDHYNYLKPGSILTVINQDDHKQELSCLAEYICSKSENRREAELYFKILNCTIDGFIESTIDKYFTKH